MQQGPDVIPLPVELPYMACRGDTFTFTLLIFY